MGKKLFAWILLAGILSWESMAIGYFDWREFGAKEARKAPAEPLARAQYIAFRVGQELKRQGIRPNTSAVGRVMSFIKHWDQSLGTCNDLAEVMQDALNGAGFPSDQLYSVVTSKEGLARFNKGRVFDVNLDHAVAVLVINGQPYSFDLWAHGGLEGTFDNFNRSIWNGLDLESWGKTLQKYGYTAYALNKGRSSEFNTAALERLIKEVRARSGASKINGPKPATPAGGEDPVVLEYRSLYPSFLKAFHKGKRVDVIANAVKAGDKYRCANKIYDIIKDGPRKGEEYCCSSFDQDVSLANLRAAIPGMKKLLGK